MGSNMHESLLKKHKDTLTYYVPETELEGDHWLEIGLYAWEINTTPLGTPVPDNPTEAEREQLLEHADGIGLRFQTHSQRYTAPDSLIKTRITNLFDVYSTGFGRNEGLRYRIENGDVNEIRQTARELSLATLAYWWWLEHDSEYDPFVKDVRGENDQPRISHVENDGTVITTDNERIDTPYSLSGIELLGADEYITPVEQCEQRLKAFLKDISEEFDYQTLDHAYDTAYEVIGELEPSIEKTKERHKEDELQDAIRKLTNVSGIGNQTKWDLMTRFDTIEELRTAIKTRDGEIMSITQITDERIGEMITVLQNNGYWEE